MGLKELGKLSSKSLIKFYETKQFSSYLYREFDFTGDEAELFPVISCFVFW